MRRGQRQGPAPFTVGVVVLVLIGIGTYLGFRKEVPFRHHHEIRAVFTSANNVRKDSPVRIAGVNVGKVVRIDHVPGSQAATVTMRIDDKGLPLHTDARARIRPRIFLEGNFFVDLSPGSPSAPLLGDRGTIPINQTAAPVQIDQVLTTLQASTRQDLRRLLQGLSSGLAGAGSRGYNASIPYWAPAYRSGAVVADATQGTQEHDLSGYVDSSGRVAAALDRDPAALRSLVGDFDATAAALASHDGAIGRAVGELPRTLRAAQPALAALNRAFPPVRRLVRDLRPGVRSSVPALDAAIPLARQLRGLVQPAELRGLVADLRPAVPRLTQLDRRSVPLLTQTRLASSCQNQVVLPWTHDRIQDPVFPATGPVYEDSLKVLPGLAGESRTGDANGQWFRVLVSGGLYAYPGGGGDVMLAGQPLLGVNPPAAPRPPLRADVPCETQDQPDLRTRISPVTGGRRAEVPASKQDELRRITARTVRQVRHLIDRQGLAGRLRVTTKPATDAVLQTLGAIKARALHAAPEARP